MKKRLLIVVSSHGFGHFAMTSPIINQLIHEDRFEIILRTQVPRYLIDSRLNKPVELIEESTDFGMKMNSSLDVDVEASRKAYVELHRNWDSAVQREMESLQRIQPDLLLANIPYLTLAAANKAGIPSLALCSLNWAEITADYFQQDKDFTEIYIPQMNAAYNSAQQFICPAPAMPMPELHNVSNIGPISIQGTNRKHLLLKQFDLPSTTKLVLITTGGVATNIPVEQWPHQDKIVWLCAWNASSDRKDIIYQNQTNFKFSDLMASTDLVITKAGYGMVSECVCHGKPALYVGRHDWAEEPHLIKWWQAHGVAHEISRDQFFTGQLQESIFNLLQHPTFVPPAPSGIQQAVDIINQFV